MNDTINNELSQTEQSSRQNRTRRVSGFRVVLGALTGLALAGALAKVSDVAALSPTQDGCTRPGSIWWNELLAPETDKLTDFYAKVIGWKTKVVDAENQSLPARTPNDRYTVFMDGDQEIAGLMRANHPEAIHSGLGWFTYIQVENVDAAVAMAQASGGAVLRPVMETDDSNRIAVVSDPMGNVVGLVTPANKGC